VTTRLDGAVGLVQRVIVDVGHMNELTNTRVNGELVTAIKRGWKKKAERE